MKAHRGAVSRCSWPGYMSPSLEVTHSGHRVQRRSEPFGKAAVWSLLQSTKGHFVRKPTGRIETEKSGINTSCRKAVKREKSNMIEPQSTRHALKPSRNGWSVGS